MPAISIGGREYQELAIRRIREPVDANITGAVLPTGAATEVTLQQVRDAIKATIDLESTIWTDNSGAYYVRRDIVNEGTGAITIAWTDPSGAATTPGAGLRPLSTAERDVTKDFYTAIANGTGYSISDLLARLLIIDPNPATPVITPVWYNLTTSAIIAAPPSGDIQFTSTGAVTVTSSALPTGAATAANQVTTNNSLSSIDGKLPSSLTVSATRLLVDGSGVTQPVSATALPLPTGAATAAGQTTTNNSLSSIDGKLPANLTVSSTRLLVDGSGVTQPVSATALPLPTGAATAANQATANNSLSSIDTKLPSNLTVSATRLLVDGSGVTQPVSAAALPLPTGAATAANQATANNSLSSIDTKLPSNLTVSATRLLVDGSGVTQPVSASSLPLPTGAATAANQATANTSLNNLDVDLGAVGDAAATTDTGSFSLIALVKRALQNWTTLLGRIPTLTVSSTRLLVDGSGVTQPTSVAVRTPTTTSVSSSATSVTILASNSNRRGFSISNVSTAKLYLSFSTPATTANSFIEIPSGGFLLLDQQLIVTNAIYGIWASANGTAQVTEYV